MGQDDSLCASASYAPSAERNRARTVRLKGTRLVSVEIEYISYATLQRDVYRSLHEIKALQPDAVFGTPRSGMIPASMIAMELSLPLGMTGTDPTPTGGRRLSVRPSAVRRALLVDDSLSSGHSLAESIQWMKQWGYGEIMTYVPYINPGRGSRVTAFSRVVPSRIFQWNLFNRGDTHKAVFDMDGVLCRDPLAFDDDGPSYALDLELAPQMAFPRHVGTILTARLERWRDVTETWLQRAGIKYETLIMHPARTAQERRKSDLAAWKAKAYQASQAPYMVESHDKWAKLISSLAGPVISVESHRIFYGGIAR